MAGKTTRVVMPQLGESVHEGTISKWLVKPGDKVVEFEPMLEVETDKVATEVPSPVTGVLREIVAQEGATVPSGGEIAVVELESDGKAATAEKPPPQEPTKQAEQPAEQAGEPAKQAEEPAPREQPAPAPAAAAQAPHAPPAAPERETASDRLPSGELRYSPAVRLLAEEKKVDLESLAGTGLAGRVTKKDVLAAAEQKGQPA